MEIYVLCQLEQNNNLVKLDMSTARRHLKSPQSLHGTSTHPIMPPIGHSQGHEWSTHIPFVPCQSATPNSSNEPISNFDLETTRSRSWVWSRGKTIQSAQYLTDLLSFCFTSIRSQFLRYSYFEIRPWNSKVMSEVKRSMSHSSPSIQPMHLLFGSHQSDQPFLRYVQ